ncbi:MAG: NYN domain-containing protein [Pseudomonadota bacterium]
MPYLIDGNNVMGRRSGRHRDTAGARRRFIQELAGFVAVHRVRVQVVFDGVPDEEFPEGTTYRSVRILYAKRGSDADSRIKDMIRRSSYKRDMVVVSSDREVMSFANRQGTRVMPAARFRTLLDEAGAVDRGKADVGVEDPGSIDEWLEFFGKPP